MSGVTANRESAFWQVPQCALELEIRGIVDCDGSRRPWISSKQNKKYSGGIGADDNDEDEKGDDEADKQHRG